MLVCWSVYSLFCTPFCHVLAMEWKITDPQILLNQQVCFRITYFACCEQFYAHTKCYLATLSLLEAQPNSQDIISWIVDHVCIMTGFVANYYHSIVKMDRRGKARHQLSSVYIVTISCVLIQHNRSLSYYFERKKNICHVWVHG